jgi:hypothetical protein
MKATIEGETQKEQEWKFPCLGVDKDGDVVLFFEHMKGTIVVANELEDMAFYTDNWKMSDFKLLKKDVRIILQND